MLRPRGLDLPSETSGDDVAALFAILFEYMLQAALYPPPPARHCAASEGYVRRSTAALALPTLLPYLTPTPLPSLPTRRSKWRAMPRNEVRVKVPNT